MMIKFNTVITWRGALMFSAAFFCLALVATSCKKKKSPIGQGALPPGSEMSSSGVDTFQLFTYTIEEDSTVSMDPRFNLLGSYIDPVFGSVDASFYTQFTVEGFSPVFPVNYVVDSVVMAFEFGGYYGGISEQTFEVFEITEDLTRDSAYLSSSSATTNGINLVEVGSGQILPDLQTGAVVGNDTLDPQLRIRLENSFGQNLMTLAAGSSDSQTFLQSFKGLQFKVNNPMQSAGEGTIYYLSTTNPASKLTVYYTNTDTGDPLEFDFLVGGSMIDFNHIENDITGTDVEAVINDPSQGQDKYYAQTFRSRAKIDFPSLNDIPEDVIIHQATLEIPVDYYQGSDLYPSSFVNISSRLYEDLDNMYLLHDTGSPIAYNLQKKAYVINLREYVQNVLTGEFVNNGVIISPRVYNSTTERIIFNGPQSVNKKQPKLNVVYTKL
jgi:hypothetical protein